MLEEAQFSDPKNWGDVELEFALGEIADGGVIGIGPALHGDESGPDFALALIQRLSARGRCIVLALETEVDPETSLDSFVGGAAQVPRLSNYLYPSESYRRLLNGIQRLNGLEQSPRIHAYPVDLLMPPESWCHYHGLVQQLQNAMSAIGMRPEEVLSACAAISEADNTTLMESLAELSLYSVSTESLQAVVSGAESSQVSRDVLGSTLLVKAARDSLHRRVEIDARLNSRVREIAMAENVQILSTKFGPECIIVFVAGLDHVMVSPYLGEDSCGMMLRNRLGSKYYAVGGVRVEGNVRMRTLKGMETGDVDVPAGFGADQDLGALCRRIFPSGAFVPIRGALRSTLSNRLLVLESGGSLWAGNLSILQMKDVGKGLDALLVGGP